MAVQTEERPGRYEGAVPTPIPTHTTASSLGAHASHACGDEELPELCGCRLGAPLPAGPRVAVFGNSGGLEALTADGCVRRGLAVPERPATKLVYRLGRALRHLGDRRAGTLPAGAKRRGVDDKHGLGPAMTGALVQPMVTDGVEIIIGGVEHPAFGPLIMVGMGGLTAELLTDRAFRVPPITRRDAAEMLRELRCFPLLTGYRGRPKVNVGALEEQIVRVARFLEEIPEAAELDLNPVLVTPRGAAAVDVRLRLAPLPPPPSPYRRRLR